MFAELCLQWLIQKVNFVVWGNTTNTKTDNDKKWQFRNDRNTNNEFSLIPHKFIAPAGEKKTRTNRETERQKEEEGGGVVIREGREPSVITTL